VCFFASPFPSFFLPPHGRYQTPATFVSGFGPAMLACAGLALAGVVAGLLLPRRRPVPATAAPRILETSR
jgi:hypothetical protein